MSDLAALLTPSKHKNPVTGAARARMQVAETIRFTDDKSKLLGTVRRFKDGSWGVSPAGTSSSFVKTKAAALSYIQFPAIYRVSVNEGPYFTVRPLTEAEAAA